MATVKILNAALDEAKDQTIILRGTIDLTSLPNLKVDPEYQRENLPGQVRKAAKAYINRMPVSDITLGMRGDNYHQTDESTVELRDPVYVIDGQQRCAGAEEAIRKGCIPRVGAVIYFETDAQFERRMFELMGTQQAKISPNILLRNRRLESAAVKMLYDLTLDPSFPLYERVQWSQNMRRGQLITAMILSAVSIGLHGWVPTQEFKKQAVLLEVVYSKIGHKQIGDNIRQFFNVVEACWGLRQLQAREKAPHLTGTFLRALARFLGSYEDFWAEDRLSVKPFDMGRLKSLDVHDPEIKNLTHGNESASLMLLTRLCVQVNQGRREKLQHRNVPRDKGGKRLPERPKKKIA
jgi:hypothetical protein